MTSYNCNRIGYNRRIFYEGCRALRLVLSWSRWRMVLRCDLSGCGIVSQHPPASRTEEEWQLRIDRKRLKRETERALVKMSASWSLMGKKDTVNVPLEMRSLTKWKSMSTCFVRSAEWGSQRDLWLPCYHTRVSEVGKEIREALKGETEPRGAQQQYWPHFCIRTQCWI